MAAKEIKSIDEALSVLEEAAQRSSSEVRELIERDYRHLREAFMSLAPEVERGLKALSDQSRELYHVARERTINATRDAARVVDESIHENPWYYLGSAAVVGGLLGYLVARKSNHYYSHTSRGMDD